MKPAVNITLPYFRRTSLSRWGLLLEMIMGKTLFWITVAIIFLALLPARVFAVKIPNEMHKAKRFGKTHRISVPFIENMGQLANKDVSFYAKTFAGTVFVGKNGTLTYSLPLDNNGSVIIKEIFDDTTPEIRGLEPSSTKVNYFKGNDKSKWKSNIPSYDSIYLGEIYKGINMKLRAYGNNLEKLFSVLPGENPERIKVKVEGAKKLEVLESGELLVLTEHGSVNFTRPLAYQEINGKRVEIIAKYTIHNSKTASQPCSIKNSLNSNQRCTSKKYSSYGFKVGNYNKNYPLIIDPLLGSTFIGGGSYDVIYGLEVRESVYVAGFTYSSDFPTTLNSFDDSCGTDGNCNYESDVFVSKLDTSLTTLEASTFIGGVGYDVGYGLALDASGNVYVTGLTASSDFPTTAGAYDESYNGGSDAFVSKLDSSLSILEASTFIGGTNGEEGNFIALDPEENLYLLGFTASSDCPTTPGAYDESYNGDWEAFVSKLDSNLSTLEASTYIGGSAEEWGYSLSLDGSGNVYITGFTGSTDYPTTPGAYDESYNGDWDVFVSKFDSSLTTLEASTFIGGSSTEIGNSMAIDIQGKLYVAGGTVSSEYPTTTGAYDRDLNGNDGAFISKFDSSLTTLEASTFMGGTSGEVGSSLVLDGSGNVYIAGITESPDFPTTAGAYKESFFYIYSMGYHVFISKLDSNLNILQASTYMGGSGYESRVVLALDESKNVYIAGLTHSPDYPTALNPFDNLCGTDGKCNFEGFYSLWPDAFISKLDTDLSAGDLDNDGIMDSNDNCYKTPNGFTLGICIAGALGNTCLYDGDCGTDGLCSMNQEDSYPPQGNRRGDACDCEGNFDYDADQDGSDAATFKIDFGRSIFSNPCVSGNTCNGDFICDGDVDGTDAALFKQDFGRSSFSSPCPMTETVIEWCSYPSP